MEVPDISTTPVLRAIVAEAAKAPEEGEFLPGAAVDTAHREAEAPASPIAAPAMVSPTQVTAEGEAAGESIAVAPMSSRIATPSAPVAEASVPPSLLKKVAIRAPRLQIRLRASSSSEEAGGAVVTFARAKRCGKYGSTMNLVPSLIGKRQLCNAMAYSVSRKVRESSLVLSSSSSIEGGRKAIHSL